MNESILLLTLLLSFGGVLFSFRFFGKGGLYGWGAFATVCANIEVVVMIDAFGMEQTLGNVLFASSFLVSDIVSELYGKEEATRWVRFTVAVALLFAVTSQLWIRYRPSPNDWAMEHFLPVFQTTPRIIICSFAVFALVQGLDVRFYHAVWQRTRERSGNRFRYLWLRNNLSTLLSQLVNTVLFTFGAFWGRYPLSTLLHLVASTYLIYAFLSLIDTFFIYTARKWYLQGKISD